MSAFLFSMYLHSFFTLFFTLAAAQQQNDDEQEQQQEELTCRVRKESYRGRGKTIALRDCSARKVPGTCVIFFVGSGPRATRPL